MKNIYVSPGGLKLEAALKHFKIDVKNKICFDIGAGAGGFTDCLLRFGAKKVYALDRENNLLNKSLADNPHVVSFEGVGFDYFDENSIFNDKIDFVTVDLQYSSLRYIIKSITAKFPNNPEVLVLCNPQVGVARAKSDTEINKNVEDIINFSSQLKFQLIGTLKSLVVEPDDECARFIYMKKPA